MANVIRHKRGTSNPAAGDFSQTAELLVNTTDGGLFTKTDGGSVVEIGGDVSFDDLTGKTAGTGDYSTSGDIVSGRGSGGVALTINDGKGNANVTFNHQNGVPEQNGNAARIEVNADATTNARMYFELKSGVSANTNVNLTNVLTLSETEISASKPLDVTGNITVSGTVDGRDLAADGSKLDGIESGATADQTAAEILAAIKTVDGSGSGLDADTLDGQQGSYYAPLASPTFTGTPAAPTASAGTNTTQVATTAFVQTAVANVVDSAPGALDTLNELAAALGDDANFSTTVTNSIGTKLPLAGGQMTGNITFSGSQTVDGRDLSVDGAKLDGIEAGATADQTASEILTAIKTVDGSGSGLDADTVDGVHASSFFQANNALSATTGAFSGDVTINADLVMGSGGQIQFASAATRDKLRLWGSSAYAIGMDNAMSFGALNDYAMTFQFNDEADRGFWWGHTSHSDAQGAMSLTTGGKLVVADSFRVGGGTSDTSAPVADIDMAGTGAIKVANGTTAQRPTGANGLVRYNTTLGALESYVSGAWQVIANTALDYGLITSASDTTFDYGALS